MQKIRILSLAALVSAALFVLPVQAGPQSSPTTKASAQQQLVPTGPSRYAACPAGTQRDPACMDPAARTTADSYCPCQPIPEPEEETVDDAGDPTRGD